MSPKAMKRRSRVASDQPPLGWVLAPPTMDDLIRVLRAWRLWILGGLVSALLGAAIYALLPPPYRARATVNVDFHLELAWPQSTDREQFYYLERETRKLVEIAFSDSTLGAVTRDVAGVTLQDLRSGAASLSQPGNGGWHFFGMDQDPQTRRDDRLQLGTGFQRGGPTTSPDGRGRPGEPRHRGCDAICHAGPRSINECGAVYACRCDRLAHDRRNGSASHSPRPMTGSDVGNFLLRSSRILWGATLVTIPITSFRYIPAGEGTFVRPLAFLPLLALLLILLVRALRCEVELPRWPALVLWPRSFWWLHSPAQLAS